MNNTYGDSDYAIWNERTVVSDCLRKLGYDKLAAKVHTPSVNGAIIDSYIKLIAHTARSLKKQDVLDLLAMSGLIYG